MKSLVKVSPKIMLIYQVQSFMTKECDNFKASYHMHMGIDMKYEKSCINISTSIRASNHQMGMQQGMQT